MADIKTFYLPDLGEGLPDATVVEWHVKVGDNIKLDAPLCSMETAKAVVDVPSPYTGKVTKLHGMVGEVIETGAALVDFEPDPNAKQRAESEPTGHHHGPKKTVGNATTHDAKKTVASDEGGELESHGQKPAGANREDEGTVVGAMISGSHLHIEQASSLGGVKAVPAVRALAKKLKIDLTQVHPSGAGGVVTLKDVKDAAANGSAAPPLSPAAEGARNEATMPGMRASDRPEQLKGARRNMARVMADAHAQVVPTSIVDDADLHAWIGKQDITVRLIRAMVFACKSVPALNAWFDGASLSRTLRPHVDIGIAVDTDDGLFVPALRNAEMLEGNGVRAAIERLRAQVEDRSIPPSELSGHSISLSNFGMFAGRYATPIVVPPTVAIVGAGKLSHDVVAVIGGIEVHRRLPLSLTFDHRAATGGEAARFLKALIDDLALPQ